ncbi:MAG: MBG domain-containing protein [Prevotellaceae bacterium]|nr:MBG domain-containing protein [Prevotellaceae bacterium]
MFVTNYANAIEPPVLDSKTTTSITLKEVSGAEYKYDEKEWQSGRTFTNLVPNTEYTFYVKKSSETSAGTKIKTDTATLKGTVKIEGNPVYKGVLTVNISELKTNVEGYDNFGTIQYQWYKNDLIIAETKGRQNSYSIDGEDIGGKFKVVVRGTNTKDSISSASTGAVDKAQRSAPLIQNVTFITTDTSIEINVFNDGEYKIGAGSQWYTPTSSADNKMTFNNLIPNKEYTLYARLIENYFYYASPEINVPFTTQKATLSGTVTITGNFVYKQTLQTDTSTLRTNVDGYRDFGNLKWEWLRDGNTIDGANDKTYTLTSADIGKTINVKITGDNVLSEVVTSNSTIVAKATPTADDLQFTPNTMAYGTPTSGNVTVSAKEGIEGMGETFTITYLKDGTEYSDSDLKKPGNYQIIVSVSGGDYYTAATGLNLGDFVIDKRNTTAADLQFEPDAVTYDGTVKSVNVSTKIEDEKISFTIRYDGKPSADNFPIDVDTLEITVDASEGDYHKAANNLTLVGKFIIKKAIPKIGDLQFSLDTVEYDGTAKSVTVSAKEGIKGMGNISVKYNNSLNVPTSPGKYQITADISDGKNYTAETLLLGEFVIKKATPSINDLQVTIGTVAYNGSPQGVDISANENAGDVGDITIKYNGSEEKPTAPGEYEITVDISGNDNYTGVTDLPLGLFVIEKAIPNIDNFQFTPNSVVYDGTAKNVVISAKQEIDGMGMGRITAIKYENSADAPIGSGEYAITIDVFDTINYTGITDLYLGKFIISKATITAEDLKFSPSSAEYDGTAKSVTVSTKKELEGIGIITTTRYNGNTEKPIVPNTYAVSADVAEGSNYFAATGLDLGNFVINKATQPAPDKLSLLSKTSTSIVLQTIEGAEYRNGTGEWQPLPIFDGLEPNTSYTFYARIKGNDTHEPSPLSAGFSVATDPTPVYSISLTPSGNHSFNPAKYGYVAQEVYEVTVNNTGNQPTGVLNISLNGESSRFTLSKNNINNISKNENNSFTLVPETGLAAGVYLATVTISGSNDISASFEISFTVNKAVRDTPESPGLLSKTSTTVALTTVEGAEYRNGSGEWQDSPVFEGLTPNTTYIFYARMKGDDNNEASATSEGLPVTTEVTPLYGISLTPLGNHTFTNAVYDYGDMSPYYLMISNVGNQHTGDLNIVLNGKNNDKFSLSQTSIENLDVNNNKTFSIIPNSGLLPGTYSATVTVNGSNNISASIDINFTVNKATHTGFLTFLCVSKTSTSVILNTITGAEYRNGTGEWQDNPIFEGLTPNTTYVFYARMKESETHQASPISYGLPVITDIAPSYGISLNPYGNYTFANAAYNYKEPQAYSVTINNTGNQPTGILNITVSGESSRFILSKTSIEDIVMHGTNGFIIVPEIGLETGLYLATVTISGSNGISASFDISFTVTKASQTAPEAPTFADTTVTSVTLNTIAGAEYRNGTGEWQDSPTFSGLTPNTTYTFYARIKETGTHRASRPSSGTPITLADSTVINGIVLEPAGNHTFPTELYGYNALATYKITVSNIGNQPASVNIALSGENSEKFTLSRTKIDNLGVNGRDTFSIVPNTGLMPGVYAATVIVSGSDIISASVDVSFTVNKAIQTVPNAPTLKDSTSTSVTLNTITGAEYRNGSGGWQDSPTFEGLMPHTPYVFYARMKSSDTLETSLSSDGLLVVTAVDIPDYGISLNPSGSHIFSTTTYGYTAQQELSVTVSNVGDHTTPVLNIELGGKNGESFTLSGTKIDSIAVNSSQIFTVVPKTELLPGTYLATVTISGSNDISASFEISFTVDMASQTAPEIPKLASKTSTNITLEVIPGAEYCNGTGEWQDLPIFDGLTPNTSYTFYARMKKTDTHEASPSSEGLSVATGDKPIYGISLSPSGNYTFASAIYDYGAQTAYKTVINNVGAQSTGILNIFLSGDDGNKFTLSKTSIEDIHVGDSSSFLVTPKTELEAGVYSAIVTISGGNGISASFNISFTVKRGVQLAPEAPTVKSKTSTSITLNTIPGAEYRNGVNDWQDSPVFDGLIPNSSYSFYARMKKTVAYEASGASDRLTVNTDPTPTYGIALDPNSNYIFQPKQFGDNKLPAKYVVTISNVGTQPTGKLNITLNGKNSDAFTLSKTTVDNIAVNGSYDLSVSHNLNLAVDLYLATVKITGENGILADFDLSLTVTKATLLAPTLTLNKAEATKVTLNPIPGAEYCNGRGEWQDSPVFTGLTPSTSYTFYARMKGDDRYEASPFSGLTVTTGATPSYGISLNPPGNHIFDPVAYGYSSSELIEYNITVCNVGDQPTDVLDIILSGENSSSFVLSKSTISNLNYTSSEGFYVKPGPELLPGSYIATVTVRGNNDISASFDVSFTVNKIKQDTPAPPILKDRTDTTVVLEKVDGVEYRNGITGEWQDSPVFEGLTQYSTYTFYARMKETDTHEASAPSEGLPVTTLETEAKLIELLVNDFRMSLEKDSSEYITGCGETSVKLDIVRSPSALASVNGKEYYGGSIELEDEITYFEIVVSNNNQEKRSEHILTVYKTLEASELLFQRWDNVLAVNSNPKNNGGHPAIDSVRWYKSEEPLQEPECYEWYIRLDALVEEYSAQLKIYDRWLNVCGAPKQRNEVRVLAYPNPVSIGDNLTLYLPEGFENSHMNVISFSGSTVKQKIPLPKKSNTISVADWAPGVYLLNIISTNGNSETVKIIVNN